MTIALYCIYNSEAFENVDINDIPDEAWEWMKKFNLENILDYNDFCEQLKTHYSITEIENIIWNLIDGGFCYDYDNWYKYTVIQ